MALLLAGCFGSDKPLLDTSQAETPFEVGAYYAETLVDGAWQRSPDNDVVLEITKDRAYVSQSQDRTQGRPVHFMPLGKRFVGMMRSEGDAVQYILAERRNDQIIFFDADCQVFKKSSRFVGNEPDEVDGSRCKFKSRAKLIASLNAYAETATAVYRLTRGSPPANSAPTPSAVSVASTSTLAAEDRLFELSVCNKSKTIVRYIAFYRHPQDEAKWLLKGWWKVDPDKCHNIKIPRGYFYLSAHGENGSVWAGKDRYLCISNRVTERVVFENEQCLVGETNRGFHERFNVEDKYSFPLIP